MDNYYKVPEEELLHLVESRYILGYLINDMNWTFYRKAAERARLEQQKKYFPSLPEDMFVNWTELTQKEVENNYEKI